jgi:hypothetical protein
MSKHLEEKPFHYLLSKYIYSDFKVLVTKDNALYQYYINNHLFELAKHCEMKINKYKLYLLNVYKLHCTDLQERFLKTKQVYKMYQKLLNIFLKCQNELFHKRLVKKLKKTRRLLKYYNEWIKTLVILQSKLQI